MTEFSAALPPDEWADLPEHVDAGLYSAPAAWHRAMAVANARLPEGHRGKLTRADVALLHRALAANTPVLSDPPRMAEPPLTFGEQMRLRALADALESILPPEGT